MKANTYLVIKNKVSGNGTYCIVYMTRHDTEKLSRAMAMVEVEIRALEYPPKKPKL